MGVGEWGEKGGGKELTERGIQKHPDNVTISISNHISTNFNSI